MSAVYKDARLKVTRAKKHIADFTAAVIALEDTCTATVEHNAGGGQSLKHEIPDADRALDEMSLIAGDAIHNLRSALDFAWYSTIGRCLPDKLSGKTKFSVMETKQDLEGTLHGIEVDTRYPRLFECMVMQIQPYKGADNPVVRALHDLDISDKHLLLLNLGTFSTADGISVRDASGNLHLGATMLTATDSPGLRSLRGGLLRNRAHYRTRKQERPMVGGLVDTLIRGIPGTECFAVSDKPLQLFRRNRQRKIRSTRIT